jgi:hypothetical protein
MQGLAILQPESGSRLKGTLTMNQPNSTDPVEITGVLSGLDPNSSYTLTIQPNGNLTEGCFSTMRTSTSNAVAVSV